MRKEEDYRPYKLLRPIYNSAIKLLILLLDDFYRFKPSHNGHIYVKQDQRHWLMQVFSFLVNLLKAVLEEVDSFLAVLHELNPVCETHIRELKQYRLLAHKLVIDDKDLALISSHIHLPVVIEELDQSVDFAWDCFLSAILEYFVHSLLSLIDRDCGTLELCHKSIAKCLISRNLFMLSRLQYIWANVFSVALI